MSFKTKNIFSDFVPPVVRQVSEIITFKVIGMTIIIPGYDPVQ